ncbi:hypothetical protein V1264_010370 [Littorina saxatilis]|uniref:Uncharacterized protein n=1 Tax=Littorina saxatilis TaxID=31220 RepID=A0AAN9AP61_9CAEN
MGVCLACVLFSSFILNQLSQGQGFEDNTTLIVNQTSILTYFSGTREWLAADELPQFSRSDFQFHELESVAVHFAWKYLLFSDRARKTIFVYPATIGGGVYAHVGTSPSVGHVTVDWLSNNVYWADTGLGWIGLQPLRVWPLKLKSIY